MAAPQNDELSADLASLRIRRGPEATPSGRRRSLWPLWLVAFAALAAVAGVEVYQRYLKKSWLAPEVETTQVVLVAPDQQASLLVATGYVVAERQATVSPKVAGKVTELDVDANSLVRAGDVLARLDRSDVHAALAQAEADAAAARAQVLESRASLESARVQSEREKALLEKKAIGEADATDAALRVESAEAALAVAQAQSAATQARVQVTATQLADLTVRAPFAGTVLKRLTQVGETVAPGNGVCMLSDMASLEVETDVAEAQIGKVRSGQPVEVQLDAFPDQRFAGSVEAIVPDVDRSKATATVRVRFAQIPPGAFPDMAAKVTFLARPLSGQALGAAPKTMVQSSALLVRNGVAEIFVVGDGGAVTETPVALGAHVGELVELTSGPVAGTKLIASPGPDLHTGSIVKEKSAD